MTAFKPLLLTAMLALSSIPALAQRPSPKPEQSTSADVSGLTFDLDFPGGPLKQYVETIKASVARMVQNGAVNVVFADPAAADYVVPTISIHAVSLETALRAAINPSFGRGANPDLPVIEIVSNGNGAPVYVFTMIRKARSGNTPSDMQHVEIFDVRDITRANVKMETVLTALDAALQMEASTSPPDIKFHEDSGLLILRATNAQIDDAKQVIGHMADAARVSDRDSASRDRALRLRRLEEEMRALYDQLGPAKAKSYAAENDANRAESMVADARAKDANPDVVEKAVAKSDQARLTTFELGYQVQRLEREISTRATIIQQLRTEEFAGAVAPAGSDRLRAENNDLREQIKQLQARIAALEAKPAR